MKTKNIAAQAGLVAACLAWASAVQALGFVEKYERMLSELGVEVGPIDDILDVQAQNAVRDFQRFHGLEVTGLLNPETQAEIEAAHTRKFSSSGPSSSRQVSGTRVTAAKAVSDGNPADSANAQPVAEDGADAMPASQTVDTAGTAASRPPMAHKLFRLGLGYSRAATVVDDGVNEATVSSGIPLATAALQLPVGLFVQAAAGEQTIDEIELNNVTTDVDISEDVLGVALGWRFPAPMRNGTYVGVLVSALRVDDEDSQQIGVYSEKDTSFRYGRITAGLILAENADLFGVSGEHLWFPGRGLLGLGLNWALAGGETDFDEDIGSFALGAMLKLRF